MNKPIPPEAIALRVTDGAAESRSKFYRILIIDSDEAGREMTRGLLKLALKEGVTVLETSSLQTGIEHMLNHLPDCVLIDAGVSGTPIAEALQCIKLHFNGVLPCPLVVLSEDNSAIEASDFLCAGAHDGITKDWLNPPFLRRVIDKAIERFQVERRSSKQAHELASVHAQLSLANQAAQMGNWTYNLKTGGGVVDELCAQLCDRTIEELAAPGGGMEHVYPEDREKVMAAFDQAIAGGRYHCEFRSVRRDGSVHWLAGMGDVVRDDAGDPVSFIGVTWDIDERKQAELRRIQLLDELIALAFLVDTDGNLVEANKLALKAIGYTRSDIVGQRFDQTPWWCDNDDDRQSIWSCLQIAFSGKECRKTFNYRAGPDGNIGKLDLQTAPIFDNQNTVIAAVISGVDITARFNAEAELQKALINSQRNEAFNRALMDGSPDCLKVLDINGNLLLMNHPGLVAMEIDNFELFKGKPWWSNWPNDAQPLVKQSVDRAKNGQAFVFEAFCPTAAGTPKWWNVSVSPVKGENDDIVRLLAVSRDVTEQRSAEIALRRSEKELRAVTANTPDVLARFDQHYRHLFVSDAVTAASGLPPEAYIGKTNREMWMPAHLCDEWERQLEATFTTGELQRCEFSFPSPGGERHFEARLVPEKNAQGEVETVLSVTRDVTDHRNMEIQLRKSMDEAEQANSAKDHFLAVLSHELRTPLTPVLAAVSELCQRVDLPTDVKEDLQMIRRNVELEARLMDDLLDLTRVSRGKIELNFRPVNIHLKIQRVQEMVAADAQSKRITLDIQTLAAHSFIRGDAARIQQIFWNLLKNAVKFTRPGGKVSLITENFEEHDQAKICVQISDTGVGIEPNILPRVFDAFEQGGSEMTRQFGGLGLGLAISKVLTDLHGGTISAESKGTNQGATFTVVFPVATAVVEAVSEPVTSKVPLVRLRVLLVEDHPDTSTITARLLSARGMIVRTASSVADALRTLGVETFDVMVSDLGLPDGSGHDLLRQARALGIAPPSVVVSGFGSDKDRQHSSEVGFAEHLTKPIDLEQLTRAIQATVEKSITNTF